MNSPCPKCGHDPNDEPDFIHNYVNATDQILLCCPKCGFAWLVEPKEQDTPPEGLDCDISNG